MISTAGLAKSFGDRTLFSDVSLRLQPGERYGLVGANGSGKTTLLNIMSGDMEPSEGSVSIPRGLRLGVLRQDHFAFEDEEILRVAMRGNPVLWQALAAREELLAHVQAGGEFDGDRFSQLEEVVERHDGYTAEARAATILEGLGLPDSLHRDRLSTLSGGFKLRVLLAQVLAGAPDALLLDEPTNHLDILSIRWLEKFMRDFKGPLVVISHDHRFLDNVVTHILDVDYETVIAYPGNYSAFQESKRTEHERREKEIVSREKEIAHHRKFVDRFRAKASKARQAQSKLRLIEKKAAALDTLPGSSRRYPAFRFEPARASGREVFQAIRVRKSFGDNQVLHGVDFAVRRGDRLAILGPNGIGKSTLLKIALDELPADAGSVRWGYEARVGYFAQDHEEQLDEPGRTAQDWIWDACAGRDVGYVRAQLGLVLFSGDDAAKPLSALSGGEAARLVFCRLAIQQPNVLVLDEPTNHLDLESIEALVEALKRFPGTLIFVSHDRWFVSQLATRILEITPGRVRDYPGTYDEYVHASGDDHLDVDTVVLKARREKRKDREGTASSRWRKPARKSRPASGATEARRDRALARFETIESRLAEIDATFADAAFYESSDPDRIRELQAEREQLALESERLMEEWMALEEQMEGR